MVHESSLSDADASDYGYFENETCLNIKQTSTGWELEGFVRNVMSFDGNGKLCSVENVYGHTSSVTTGTITDGEGNVCTFERSNGGMTVEIRGYNKRFELLPVTVSGSSGWYMLAEYKAEWDGTGAVLQKSCTDRSFYRLQNNSLACVYDGFTSVEATYLNNKPSVLEKKGIGITAQASAEKSGRCRLQTAKRRRNTRTSPTRRTTDTATRIKRA